MNFYLLLLYKLNKHFYILLKHFDILLIKPFHVCCILLYIVVY